jgi:hypothetical protein
VRASLAMLNGRLLRWLARDGAHSVTRSVVAYAREAAHREPRFLGGGALHNAGTLARDFANFVLGVVFHVLCRSVGSAAFMIDNLFHTGLFERFVRLAGRLDGDGGR